jgi:hypothetical protein
VKDLLAKTNRSLSMDAMLVVYMKWSSMGFVDSFIMKTASRIKTWISRIKISRFIVFIPKHIFFLSGMA